MSKLETSLGLTNIMFTPFQFVILLLQTFIFGRLSDRTITQLPDQIFDAEDVQIAVQGVTGLMM